MTLQWSVQTEHEFQVSRREENGRKQAYESEDFSGKIMTDVSTLITIFSFF